jgi:phage baseplate assembly protein V
MSVNNHPAFRVGLVEAQDVTNARVRVKFPDRNQLVSWWLPIVTPKTQNDKAYWIPDIGEQVVCLMDSHDEDGAVLGSIYSQVDTTPVQSADKWHLTMKDTATLEYDRSAHTLAVSIPSGGSVTITCNNATIEIDTSGNIIFNPGAELILAGGGPAVARVGDSTTCPAGTGSITSGSSKVKSG